MNATTKAKRLKAIEQEMALHHCKRLESLLKEADNLKLDSILDRWVLHKCLLLEIPLLEALLTDCGKKKQMVNRLRKTANDLAPVPNYGVYG